MRQRDSQTSRLNALHTWWSLHQFIPLVREVTQSQHRRRKELQPENIYVKLKARKITTMSQRKLVATGISFLWKYTLES